MRRRRVGGSASAVGSAATDAPVRWGVLWLLAVVALLSHIFLDWTNNYGVRPFLPFNPRWYAGSFVFIFEPVLFGLLLLGLLAPALFGLIGSEVGARSKTFRGAGWARFALLASVGLWGFRYVEHANAVGIARQQDQRNASGTRLPVDSVTASPYPVLPFRWHVVVDTPEYQRTYTLDTQLGTAVSDDQADLVYKPPVTPATRAAQQTPLGRVYLDWSPHALVRDMGVDVDGNTLVTFRDLRFAYDVSFLHGREETPLSGSVLLSPKLRLIESSMDGRTQHAGGGVER
jgi:inner membrane protein